MGIIKAKFKEYQRVKDMLMGDYITKITFQEQEQMVLKYLNDYVEVVSTFNLIVTHFPESIIEMLRGTNALLFLANSYCLTIHLKRDLSLNLGLRLPKLEKD
jgi:hypothetical protein